MNWISVTCGGIGLGYFIAYIFTNDQHHANLALLNMVIFYGGVK
jgi:hypothetical protein